MRVSKYSANGNDFVIFHTFVKESRKDLARTLCHRQNGVGADGLIVIIPHDEYDFEWEFYNADGSTAEMCGNGSRAAAHYAYENNLAPQEMKFLTQAGVISAQVDGNMVLSELTPPHVLERNIEYNSNKWYKIDTGVPHMVSFRESIDEFDIAEARELREKYNANVNIAKIDGNTLKVRTYERGVEDETLACGTGMAGCYYMALENELLSGDAKVYPKSGDTLYLGLNEKTITFKGVVKEVFQTTI